MSFQSVKWIYVLEGDYQFDVRPYLPANFVGPRSFLDQEGTCRLEIDASGVARVFANYAWDGCTPKFSIFDIVFGTPDGVPNQTTKRPKTYYASLMHDVFYQFLDAEMPLKRRAIDRIFLDIMRRDGFRPRWIYYFAVRIFGRMSHWITGWFRDYGKHEIVPQPREEAEASYAAKSQ